MGTLLALLAIIYLAIGTFIASEFASKLEDQIMKEDPEFAKKVSGELSIVQRQWVSTLYFLTVVVVWPNVLSDIRKLKEQQ